MSFLGAMSSKSKLLPDFLYARLTLGLSISISVVVPLNSIPWFIPNIYTCTVYLHQIVNLQCTSQLAKLSVGESHFSNYKKIFERWGKILWKIGVGNFMSRNSHKDGKVRLKRLRWYITVPTSWFSTSLWRWFMALCWLSGIKKEDLQDSVYDMRLCSDENIPSSLQRCMIW